MVGEAPTLMGLEVLVRLVVVVVHLEQEVPKLLVVWGRLWNQIFYACYLFEVLWEQRVLALMGSEVQLLVEQEALAPQSMVV